MIGWTFEQSSVLPEGNKPGQSFFLYRNIAIDMFCPSSVIKFVYLLDRGGTSWVANVQLTASSCGVTPIVHVELLLMSHSGTSYAVTIDQIINNFARSNPWIRQLRPECLLCVEDRRCG